MAYRQVTVHQDREERKKAGTEAEAKFNEAFAAQKYSEALQYLVKMISSGLTKAEYLYKGAVCCYMQNKDDLAMAWIQNTLSFDPNYVSARLLLARICLRTKREDDAMDFLSVVVAQGFDRLTWEQKKDAIEIWNSYGKANADSVIAKNPKLEVMRNATLPEKPKPAPKPEPKPEPVPEPKPEPEMNAAAQEPEPEKPAASEAAWEPEEKRPMTKAEREQAAFAHALSKARLRGRAEAEDRNALERKERREQEAISRMFARAENPQIGEDEEDSSQRRKEEEALSNAFAHAAPASHAKMEAEETNANPQPQEEAGQEDDLAQMFAMANPDGTHQMNEAEPAQTEEAVASEADAAPEQPEVEAEMPAEAVIEPEEQEPQAEQPKAEAETPAEEAIEPEEQEPQAEQPEAEAEMPAEAAIEPDAQEPQAEQPEAEAETPAEEAIEPDAQEPQAEQPEAEAETPAEAAAEPDAQEPQEEPLNPEAPQAPTAADSQQSKEYEALQHAFLHAAGDKTATVEKTQAQLDREAREEDAISRMFARVKAAAAKPVEESTTESEEAKRAAQEKQARILQLAFASAQPGSSSEDMAEVGDQETAAMNRAMAEASVQTDEPQQDEAASQTEGEQETTEEPPVMETQTPAEEPSAEEEAPAAEEVQAEEEVPAAEEVQAEEEVPAEDNAEEIEPEETAAPEEAEDTSAQTSEEPAAASAETPEESVTDDIEHNLERDAEEDSGAQGEPEEGEEPNEAQVAIHEAVSQHPEEGEESREVEVKTEDEAAAAGEHVASTPAQVQQQITLVMNKPVPLVEKVRMFNLFGGAAYVKKHYDAAQVLLEAALKIDPGDIETMRNLAFTFAAKGEKERAAALVTKLPRIDFAVLRLLQD